MNAQNTLKIKIFNAAFLKYIAIASMLIDHAAKALLYNCILKPNAPIAKGSDLYSVYRFYRFLRNVGRVAFPIFCFFLIQGFFYSKNKKKYFIRLMIFGALSELPFDLALQGRLIYMGHQNVMFELALALLMLIVWQLIGTIEKLPLSLRSILQAASAAGFMYLASLLKLDYGWKGLALILIMYLTSVDRLTLCVCSSVFLAMWEAPAIFAFPFLFLYNGKRGKQNKYLFYAFYPVHLLLLYLLAIVLHNCI